MQGLAQQIKEIINETCSEVLEKIELEEKEIDLMVAGLNLLEVQRKRGQDASVHVPFVEVGGHVNLLESLPPKLTSYEPQRPTKPLSYVIASHCQFSKDWAYHWAVWKDVDGDGLIDCITARLKVKLLT